MYITVMDYSTETITTLVWDMEKATTEEVEVLLEAIGYNLSQIAYMTTEENPDYAGCIEVSEILPEFDINTIKQ